jgi:hypothetical protein
MILGLSLTQFTFLHVFLSLVGIGAGVFVVFGLLTSRQLRILTALFIVTTFATSVTGFLFPFNGVTPGIVIGVLSVIALVLAFYARYGRKLAGMWRGTYVISAMAAFYFNVFVLFAQLFAKLPALKVLAPTQASPAFGLTQLVVLAVFVWLTVAAFKHFQCGCPDQV